MVTKPVLTVMKTLSTVALILDLVRHYQTLGEIRRKYADFFLGETTFEDVTDNGFAIVRRCEKGELRLSATHQSAILTVNGEEVFKI